MMDIRLSMASLALALLVPATSVAQETAGGLFSDAVMATDDSGASVLVLPISGQMVTDIRLETYEEMRDRIRELNPDLIVVEIESRDFPSMYLRIMGYFDRNERGFFDEKQLIGLGEFFHIELQDIPQIAWVKDCEGLSTLLALSWDRVFMSADARLSGSERLLEYTGFNQWPDENVRGKMTAAWTSVSAVLGNWGNRSEHLMMAMTDPGKLLSGTFRGKQVEWTEGVYGEFVLDGNPQGVPDFDASLAQEVCVSEGTVNTLQDVLLLAGIREYHFVGEELAEDVADYKINWRRSYENCKRLWGDYQQYRGWATGEDVVAYLGKSKNTLEKMIGLYRRYPAVEKRMQREYGLSLDALERMLEELKEELRRANERGGRGGSGGGNSRTGGGGGLTG